MESVTELAVIFLNSKQSRMIIRSRMSVIHDSVDNFTVAVINMSVSGNRGGISAVGISIQS